MLWPLASLPSPSQSSIDVLGLTIHVYGLLLAVGIVAATLIAERRWRAKGHDVHDIQNIAVVTVFSGVIGARLYHVATDYQLFEGEWWRVIEIWEGGLAIWGAVMGGAVGVVVMTRIRHYDTLGILDAMVPGIVIAQAIGRFGNWFNQELFGKPTDLPWGLEIDRAHRPDGFVSDTTFHPTFLYESLYCLLIAGVLVGAERRLRFRRGQVAALYVVLYTFGRFWLENLRIDNAHVIAGLRINAWVSLIICAGGVAWFVWLGSHDPREESIPAPAGVEG